MRRELFQVPRPVDHTLIANTGSGRLESSGAGRRLDGDTSCNRREESRQALVRQDGSETTTDAVVDTGRAFG